MRYERRPTPLHAARATVGALWCSALALAAFTVEHPVALAVVGVAIAAAASLAQVGRPVWNVARFALVIAALFMLINPFVVREGVTVFFRLGEVPPFGQVDLTTEALWWGIQFGVRLVFMLACFAILTCAVDPDGLLRAFRRISLRSALTASLSVRLLPVLARDGRRMAEAQRLRGVPAAGRRGQVAIFRAVATSALDRAMDVAATLEVRGYGAGRRPPRGSQPWTRHDIDFAASAVGLVAVTLILRRTGLGELDWYPRTTGDGPLEGLLAGALIAVVALLPFTERRGIV